MNLTQAQLTAWKAHMTANTNTTAMAGAGGATFVINARLATNDASDQNAIADWYNQPAKAGDNQAFANRNVWNPRVTIAQLNSAVKWQTAPAGATPADVSNSWLLWQTMLWNMAIDMTDASVRKGVTTVFGDVASGSAAGVGGSGCGQQVGRRIELTLADAVTGSSVGGAFVDAHVVQKDAGGNNVLGQTPTQGDVATALSQG